MSRYTELEPDIPVRFKRQSGISYIERNERSQTLARHNTANVIIVGSDAKRSYPLFPLLALSPLIASTFECHCSASVDDVVIHILDTNVAILDMIVDFLETGYAKGSRTQIMEMLQICDILGIKATGLTTEPLTPSHEDTPNGTSQRRTVFQCLNCPEEFKSRATRSRHMTLEHGSKLQTPRIRRKCNYCTKVFERISELHRHLLTHMKEPFVCETCGRPFPEESSLRRHRRMHTKPDMHKCETCSKGFYRADLLKKHMTTQHGGGTMHPCSHCGKEFPTSKGKTRHEQTKVCVYKMKRQQRQISTETRRDPIGISDAEATEEQECADASNTDADDETYKILHGTDLELSTDEQINAYNEETVLPD